MVIFMANESMSSLKQELDITKRKLQNTNQLYKQVKDRNSYMQKRMSQLVEEKNNVQEELLKYQAMDLKLKSKEVVKFRIDFNKMKHRTKVTKNLLDEQRQDNINFNLKLAKCDKNIKELFQIIDDISENIDYLIDENYLLKDLIIDYQYQSLWDYLSNKKPENLTKYEETVRDDSEISNIYKK